MCTGQVTEDKPHRRIHLLLLPAGDSLRRFQQTVRIYSTLRQKELGLLYGPRV